MNKTVLQILLPCLLFIHTTSLFAQLPSPCPNGPEPGEDCETACIACEFTGYMGSTANFAPGFVPSFCSQIQNDQWIGFIASTNSATFTVTPSNCTGGNGIQVALYGGCGESFISCNGGNQGNGNVPASITASMVPGTNYYLLIDGYSADECDITITVVPPQTGLGQPGSIGQISGPTTVCPGATVTYSVANVTNAAAYTWTVPTGSLINGQPSPANFDAPGGRTVEVTFGSTGGQVCVQAANSCFDAGTVCKNVQVVSIPPTTLPKVTICNNDLPYTLPWGDMINVSGTFSTTYASYLGCDSIVKQQVVVKPPIITNLVPKVVCQGDCYTVCGENYCSSGLFQKTCTSFQGCDSVVNFQLTVLNPVADILGNNLLNCAATSLTLNSAPSAAGSIKNWKKLDGTVLANNAGSIVVSQPGTIILTTTLQQGGVLCDRTDTIVITANYVAPDVLAAVSAALTCLQPTVQLTGNSTTPGATFAWSGPNGFSSTQMSPVAYAAGTYLLTATHPVSHCTATATVVVLADADVPTITATGGSVDCSLVPVNLVPTTSASAPTFAWTGPGGFTSTLMSPVVFLAGTYLVTVTDGTSGCLAIATTTVLDNTLAPLITAVGDTISCSQPDATVYATTNSSNATFQWSGPNGFSSTMQNPTVMLEGTYNVTVTNPDNSCTATASAEVVGDVQPPGAMAVGGTLNCASDPILLQGSSPAPGATFAWNGPNFTSTLANPSVSQPGIYGLVVTGPNGCTSIATTLVDQPPIPVINSVQVVNDQNNQGVGAITIEVGGSTLYSVHWFLNGQGFSFDQNLNNIYAGIYTVVVTTILDTCTTSFTITVDNLVATSEPETARLWDVNPNPASSFLNIRYLGEKLPEARLTLFDMLGRQVKTAQMALVPNVQIEVKDLPAGQYQLLIQADGQTRLQPVVIQR